MLVKKDKPIRRQISMVSLEDLVPDDHLLLYSYRAPRLAREWLENLDGQGKKCSTFFTLGGFGVDPVHHTTRQVLEKSGFIVVSSAQFLGEHPFNLGGWKAMVGRPAGVDLEAAREYAFRTYQRLSGQESCPPLDLPMPALSETELDINENNRFKVITQLPTHGGNECSMCMLCEELCPAGIMDAQSGKVRNPEKCLTCLRCVSVCPENALLINGLSASWPSKLAKHGMTETELKNQKSELYF